MPFKPSIQIPERILDIGPAGSGKTSNLLHIARLAILTGTPTRFIIGDSDFAMQRMLIGYPEIIPYVEIHPLLEWEDYERFGQHAIKTAGPDDWIVVDFIGSAWKAVQDYYIRRVFHKDIGDYFLDLRETGKKESKTWDDNKWMVINPLYNRFVMNLLFRAKSHIFCTAKSEPLSGNEGKQVLEMFQPFSCKPIAQKELAFQFHTVIVSGRGVRGEWMISTAKDRQRVELRNQVVNDFAIDYLTNIAGWRVGV